MQAEQRQPDYDSDEEIDWKMNKIAGSNKNVFGLTEEEAGILSRAAEFRAAVVKKTKSLLQTVKNIPKKIIEDFQEWKEKILSNQASENKDTYFENWGETVKQTYQTILFPAQSPESEQIPSIQNFVRKVSQEPERRIRGAGIRHSWSDIFADANQYLVSFYPADVSVGTSWQVQNYAIERNNYNSSNPNVDYLCQIKILRQEDVPVIPTNPKGPVVTKTLVEVGAGVSNEQLRRWCIANNLQYKSNVIMVEVNFVGGTSTCSHGAGLGTQTLPDYVYAYRFIDYKGNLHEINKRDHPELILSAASSIGLLGLVVSVVIELQPLQIIQFLPRNTYKDYVIPWPKKYGPAKIKLRQNSLDYKRWSKKNQPLTQEQMNQNKNLEEFKNATKKSYCEWFYFPIEGLSVFENVWDIFGPKNQETIKRVQKEGGDFQDVYPPTALSNLSQFSLWIGQQTINNQDRPLLALISTNILMRFPFAFFPKEKVFVNYPDGVHFQRGIQNFKVRDFEAQINVPSINGQPDYDLIQTLWWDALEYVEDKAQRINIALEMRLFSGSNATLAPQIGFDHVCSIEILRSLPLNEDEQATWRTDVENIFKIWRDTKDSNGNPVKIRPHWGKEWNIYPSVKEHVLNDAELNAHFRNFLNDYQKIADTLKFDKQENLRTFSNKIYRQLLNNAIGPDGPHIQ